MRAKSPNSSIVETTWTFSRPKSKPVMNVNQHVRAFAPLTAQLAQLEGRLANVTTLLDRGARITSSNLNEFYAFFPGKPIVRSSRPWSCTITNSHASFVVGLRNLVKR